MKKIISIILVIVLTIGLVSCGSSSALIGKWESEDGRPKIVEFFSDGTYASSDANHSGTYSVDGNRLKLQGVLDYDWTYTFRVKGDTLTLEMDGITEPYTYIKQ